MNPYGYQHEKLGAAIHALMSPSLAFEEKLAGAMHEFLLAFHHATPSGSALTYYLKIKEIMGDEGTWKDRAASLPELRRSSIVTAFWELDRAVSRDYFTYQAH
jgi:hypothetical protein